MSKPGKKSKIAKSVVEPNPQKIPKWKEPTIGGDDHPLAWRFSSCDPEGPFCWSNITPPDKLREVMGKLHEFETKSWKELMDGGSHPIPTHKLEKVARDRLSEMDRDDIDELMSFRLTGTNRVWCIKSGHIMRVLWWDPDHLVYEVPKDPEDRRKKRNR